MTQYTATLSASADERNSLRTPKQLRILWKTKPDSLYGEWLQKGTGGGAEG